MVAPDTTKPTLTSLTLPGTVDVSRGSAVAKVTAGATDVGLGVDYVEVILDKSFQDPSGRESYFFLRDSADSYSDGLSATYDTILTTSGSGTYTVTSVYVADKAGNYSSYTTAQLQALGLDTTFRIIDHSAAHDDVNADGVSDLVLANDAGSVVAWSMKGGAYLGGGEISSGATGFSIVGKGDFNGDGTADILLQKGGTVVEWTMKNGAYQSGTLLTAGADGYDVKGTGDFNGDGTSDVVLQNGGTVVAWTMKDGAYQSGAVLTTGAQGYGVVGTGDFNGDGTTDILLQNGGTVVEWLMKNGAYLSGAVITANGAVVDWLMQNGVYASGHVVTDHLDGYHVV